MGVFNPVDCTPPAEEACEDYPLVLSTGRRLTHYHTRTRTGRCGDMNEILGEETVDLSPLDAVALGIGQGETVRVKSRRGEVRVKTHVTERVPRGDDLDGLSLPGSQCQLADQPGFRSGHPDGGIQGLRRTGGQNRGTGLIGPVGNRFPPLSSRNQAS